MQDNHPFLDRDVVLHPKNAVAAILQLADNRYVLQKRDCKRGIFFPDHWCLFGGEIEKGEEEDHALLRELSEEIGLKIAIEKVRYFSRFDFDIRFAGLGPIHRSFYEVRVDERDIHESQLGEGQAIAFFGWRDVLKLRPITPYDAFVLWMHINRDNLRY